MRHSFRGSIRKLGQMEPIVGETRQCKTKLSATEARRQQHINYCLMSLGVSIAKIARRMNLPYNAIYHHVRKKAAPCATNTESGTTRTMSSLSIPKKEGVVNGA